MLARNRAIMLRITLFTILVLTHFSSLQAQSIDTIIYSHPEIIATYINGQDALLRDIRNNIDYNSNPGLINLKGRLKVTYVVEKDGCTSHVITFPSGFEKEMSRLFDLFLGWYPAQQSGEAVRSLNVLSLYFNLH